MIIAIDPGSTSSALVVWDGSLIVQRMYLPNEEIVCELVSWPDWTDYHCVIEMIGHYGTGMPAGQTVFDTCVWIGRFMEAFGAANCTLMKRGEVKMHLCGSMRAKDPHIRQALVDRFGAPGTKAKPGVTYGISGDLWAAFGVAVTWWDRHGAARLERAV